MDDDEFYKLKVSIVVRLRKWRLDTIDNSKWCLFVYDESQDEWVPCPDLDREGESSGIDSVIRLK